MNLYRRDFHAWADEQANLLRERKLDGLDWENLAEEIGDLSTLQRTHLGRLFASLIAQLLRWQLQPNLQCHEWKCLIGRIRDDIDRHMRDSPSLVARQDAEFADAYNSAWWIALLHTGLPEAALPKSNPFTLAQAREGDFWPESEP